MKKAYEMARFLAHSVYLRRTASAVKKLSHLLQRLLAKNYHRKSKNVIFITRNFSN